MRVQQLLLARVKDMLKPNGLTLAAYKALRLLAFARPGSLPMGKMGERLMVHPPSSPTPPADSNSAASSSGRCPPTAGASSSPPPYPPVGRPPTRPPPP